MDFNNAPEQRSMDLIPEGTVCTVQLSIRPPKDGEGVGEGGWLKRSKAGDNEYLDLEFIVIDGPFAKRKFWTLQTLAGTTEGQKQAAEISAGKIRAILESARGVRPDDSSPDAAAKRRITAWGDLDGLRFITKVAIDPGKNGYKDKNVLGEVITPDRKGWVQAEQVAKTTAAPVVAAPSAAPISKPAWAS